MDRKVHSSRIYVKGNKMTNSRINEIIKCVLVYVRNIILQKKYKQQSM